ncbi:hypothetical protein R1flu_017653 [Riccia fluitans]|uniref:Uncharacterized protein n=1 Tax=Riccia fluitans TaxID=41844 RepID=A0ABD1ZDV4_9MARC
MVAGSFASQEEHGSIRVKLMPDCAPLSVHYLVEELKASTGPPYGLLQDAVCSQAWELKCFKCLLWLSILIQ